MAQVNLPGNSHKSKPPAKKEITAIPKGRVRTRKQPLGKRFMNAFFGADANGVWHYIGWEVLLPAAKDTITDAVSQGIERLLYGEARGRSRNRRGYTNYSGPSISYNRYSSTGPVRNEPRGMDISRRGRATHDFDELVFDNRADAEAVIDGLFDILAQYDEATVSDLYELSGVSGDFTDQKWGWTELKGAGVSRKRDGYYLDLPRPTPLD